MFYNNRKQPKKDPPTIGESKSESIKKIQKLWPSLKAKYPTTLDKTIRFII